MQRSWGRRRTRGTYRVFTAGGGGGEAWLEGSHPIGSLEAGLGQFPGCGEEGVWAPAVSSVRGTELCLQWPGEVQGHRLGWGRWRPSHQGWQRPTGKLGPMPAPHGSSHEVLLL